MIFTKIIFTLLIVIFFGAVGVVIFSDDSKIEDIAMKVGMCDFAASVSYFLLLCIWGN